jgi:asparagine synthase (glutamine-hydrolysing)
MRCFLATLAHPGVPQSKLSAPLKIGELTIFLRGYVANAKELLPDRASAPPISDTAQYASCFAHAYARWGNDFARHVLGEYSVAIYDVSKRVLLLAHDALGIVPLYYRRDASGIAFASHLDLLVVRDGMQRIDEEYVADYLCYGDHYGERTPYLDVKRLELGIVIEYSARGLVRWKSWGLCVTSRIRYSDVRDYWDHLRTLVRASVEAAVPGDATTWCELSGGLDSSTVLGIVAQLGRKRGLRSISFVYPESRTADESDYIRAVVDKCGVTPAFLNADAARPFSALPRAFFAEPEHSYINLALHQTYNEILVENDVHFVLTGMGGDAVLFGDGPEPFFFGDLLLQGRMLALGRQAGRWADGSSEHRPARYWLERCAIKAMARRMRNRLIQDHPPRISWFAEHYVPGSERNGRPRKSWVPCQASVADSWFLERVLRSANVVSFWNLRASMRAEFRHPLLSVPLVEFMCAIPWEVKFSPSSDRVLQRVAFQDILPEMVARRETKGSPDQAIYTGFEASATWQRLLTDRAQIVERGYIDHTRWIDAVRLATVGRCESIKHFKAAATLEIWLRQLDPPLAA